MELIYKTEDQSTEVIPWDFHPLATFVLVKYTYSSTLKFGMPT